MTQIKDNVKHPEVAIMMSTYNGEKYLREQIDSILNQNYKNINLIVRDDGSKDATLEILKEYTDSVIVIKGDNLGCKRSFLKVAQYSAENFSNCKYFAFSDQDDFWLQDKIQAAVSSLENLEENDKPALYICRPKLVDENLHELDPLLLLRHKSERSYLYTLEEAFMLGTCAGCTMVFNRLLLNLFVKAKADDMYLHDDWIYKVCLACDGILIVDNEPHILYRQHDNNVLGGNQSSKSTWKRRFKTFKEGRVRSSKARALLDTYPEDISENAKVILNDVANYSHSIRSKCKLLFSKRFRTKSKKYNLLFKVAVLFNRF